MRNSVLGIDFDCITMQQAVSAAAEKIRSGQGGMICTPNPEIVWAATHNKELADCINQADLVLPDGVGIVWAGKKSSSPFPERVAGCDFLFELLSAAPCRVYILGGKPGVAKLAADTLSRDYSGVKVVGCADGYFSDENAIVSDIRSVSPQLLMVCLGSPKQELFMHHHKDDISNCLMIGLGGTVDILAGTEKRAPRFFQYLKLEWFYRLIKHPGRLKRQLALPCFVMAVLAQNRNHIKS